ncbi:hypothetical protein GCM10007852_35320 [Agaribacter marinus]|uniref:HTH LytTR-type domain-containing protein n=2 Tax=Agaribacter marinus TaxID=1431249 RepID=A0AA37T3R8_9ALTE|nr:hypothetical protein GCM10007852_35320 [Agaribacter marinus]
MSDKRWNTGMNKTHQTLFERFDKRPLFYLWLILAIYLFVNSSMNAFSDWTEASRNGEVPPFQLWEPFSWEYTSAISNLLLLPLLYWWFRTSHTTFQSIRRWISLQLLASLLYSMAHVGLMVSLRKLIYMLTEGQYDFGDLLSEFIYEYRKDLMGFIWFMGIYYAFTFIYQRLKGEASFVQESENAPTAMKVSDNSTQMKSPEHLLVKKLDKEFIIKVSDIEWLESAGNYVNLHSGGRIYPLRATLSGLMKRLSEQHFSQVHRSYGVNVNCVDSLSSLPSGDGEIQLKSGKVISLSRRYREMLKDKLR